MAREPLRSVNSVVSRGYKWTSKTLWGYGVGHVGNDLCASLWFRNGELYLGLVRLGLNVRVKVQKSQRFQKIPDFDLASYPTFFDFGHFDRFLKVNSRTKFLHYLPTKNFMKNFKFF